MKTPVPHPQAGNFIKKEALAQMFFCEFCEISKNTFFTEHLWATASEICNWVERGSFQIIYAAINLFSSFKDSY